ncbi:FAD-binding protein [Crenobacter sp. SG2305]|uniref:electron transfer flavoprotein subunit alpha/FixB family protein n=1 Tax=Crenobacter oryzisoli TaxID=3056844 RepID=UPI0025AAAF82|nr:FAD-binding protein [Crenobacter sp. SG2305]MDN0083760.1 FAD-binding protein [Crenobacter sp. SG2305]
MTVLVIAEHDNHSLKAATLSTIGAALQVGDDIHVLLAGQGLAAVVDATARIPCVAKVLVAEEVHLAHGLAENLAPLVAGLAGRYLHVLAPASTFGKNLLPRVAALLDVAPVSDVIAIESPDTFKRPIYAGNVIATVQSTDSVKLLTVRSTAFSPVSVEGGSAEIETIDPGLDLGQSSFISRQLTETSRPELGSARVIVSGGRGLGSSEAFKQILEPFADRLGAAIGASRAAVDAGYAPNDCQVGQTGKIVAPQLYFAVGISGAIQHLAGMKDSKVIVAINKDAEAPIFQVADYGLVGDLFELVPELLAQLDVGVGA